MKASTILMALMASVSSAQVIAAQVVDSCTLTSVLPGVFTVTNLVTSTYCPVCDAAKETGGVYTTVYATTYLAVCPTGLSSAVYTVTNTCSGTTPIDTGVPPPGFTATVTVCTACAGQPTLTVTIPAGGAAAAAPAVTAAPGSPAASALASQAAASAASLASVAASLAAAGSASAAAYASSSAAAAASAAASAASVAAAKPTPGSSTTSATSPKFTGAASYIEVSIAVVMGSVLVGMLAL